MSINLSGISDIDKCQVTISDKEAPRRMNFVNILCHFVSCWTSELNKLPVAVCQCIFSANKAHTYICAYTSSALLGNFARLVVSGCIFESM